MHTPTARLTLMPEWAEQEAVVLAWPHEETDWCEYLDDARTNYVALINAINATKAVVILLCREQDMGIIKSMVSYQAQVLLVPSQYNDTWTRDYAFLTCESELGNVPLNFGFNGWGQKFDATLDDQVNTKHLAVLCINPMLSIDTVLEGGALEIDQNQHLLTTASCLYNPKRNGDMSAQAYGEIFTRTLGANAVSVFTDGHLQGDDTDGHIDTLVRFTPLHGLVIQGAYNRPDDSHFGDLFKLKYACQQALPTHTIFELPLPNIVNQNNERLPASYANFLICNQHILFPIYQQLEDKEALEVISKAFPNYKIIAIDCATLVKQFGSLHCVTMNIPINTLKPSVLAQIENGLSVYQDNLAGAAHD